MSANPVPSDADDGAGGSGSECAVCDVACVPIENNLPTCKTGCCCCCDLRGGVLAQAGVQFFLSAVFLVTQLVFIADKGLGVPEGLGDGVNIDPIPAYSALEIFVVLSLIANFVVFGWALKAALNYELKGMRTIFRFLVTLFILSIILQIVVDPLFNSQMCQEIRDSETVFCGKHSAAETTSAETISVLRQYCKDEPPRIPGPGSEQAFRCQWQAEEEVCAAGVGSNVRNCELGALVFQIVFTIPSLSLKIWFLITLNSYIVEYKGDKGEDLTSNPIG